MNAPFIPFSTLLWVTPMVIGFSLGEAADGGWDQALTKAAAGWSSSPLWGYFLQVFEKGYHHAFLGLALMMVGAYYHGIWPTITYYFGFGLALSEWNLILQLIEAINSDLQEVTAMRKS